jgi:outer membrane protein assembly factor BamB
VTDIWYRGKGVSTRTGGAARAAVAALAALLLFACGGSSPITAVTKVSPTPVTTPTPSPSGMPTPVPTPAVPITKLLTLCKPPRQFSTLPVFAKLNGAGKIFVAADGTVWVSSVSAGVIAHFSATGAPLASYNVHTPQGVVALPNGHVLFADQGDDRVVDLDPSTLAMTTFLQLTPNSGQPGVDGLGVDPANGLLLVPDTAQGQLVSVPLAGGASTVVSSGLSQPVAAAIGPGGVIEVAAAGSNGLSAVPASGGFAKPYKGLSQLSAMAVKFLLIYVTAPHAHQVIAFNPATGHTAVQINGIDSASGLALLASGRLIVSDAKSGTLATFASC